METMSKSGSQPYGGDNSYKVFRNVKTDFGAKGDDLTDDTKAINLAISSGNRCGQNCYSSSTKNAIVYFPGGTYLVSSSIIALYGTQLIGNPNDMPILKATSRFIGLGVISTDVYVGGGKGIDGRDLEYYVNTANFYRQIRNFVIDVRVATFPPEGIAGIHYQVSQATSLFNVQFLCAETPTTKHRAVFAENGSGGFMSDLTFRGGAYGIQGGNQQFTAHRLTFNNVQTAIWVIWDWGWTWKSIHIIGSKTGFNLTSENGKTSETGSLLVQDSIFESTTNAIVSFPPSSVSGTNNTGITLDNVVFKNVTNAIMDTKGKTKPANSKNLRYGDLPSSQFISMKQNGVKGDGDTDDTRAFQGVIDRYAGTSNVIFVDAGSYILTDTIRIPPGTRIVGELWAQLVARGPKFSDDSQPRPMLQIGTKGQVGSVEIQDLLFTNVGPTKGLITVEWNLEADKPGSAAMWDCHVRIGGAAGSNLNSKECPPLKSGVNPGCKAGSLMFHLTSTASAYLENVWLWVGDHDLDDAQLTNNNNTMPQLSVQMPTWLYGTASEHATYYQYSFYKAKNIHAGMIQTESAYYQPNPKPPLPFDLNTAKFPGDPDYSKCRSNSSLSGCDSSWAVIMERSSDISFAGAGLYTWFNVYDESCVDPRTCQKSLISLKNNGKNILFMNLIGAKYIATSSSGEISAEENESSSGHPKWTHLAALQISGDGKTDDEVVFIDPTVWVQQGPTVTCNPPCTLVIPPSSLKSSSTITFPSLVTTLEPERLLKWWLHQAMINKMGKFKVFSPLLEID
ncbi:glycoside hydrolase family 55 protein [Cadophora sp. DSE1049]|nr:glycoside hydrolase family 55 protein [Cadophora sp. DSE1049]